MNSDLQDIFKLAAKYFYKKYKKKGGSQAEIAQKIGVTQSYVSAVINGSRNASLDLLNQVASILYGPFDEFLAVGRRIQKGLEAEPTEKPEPVGNVEKLIAQLTHYVMDHQRIEKELANTKDFYKILCRTYNPVCLSLTLTTQYFSPTGSCLTLPVFRKKSFKGSISCACMIGFPVLSQQNSLKNI